MSSDGYPSSGRKPKPPSAEALASAVLSAYDGNDAEAARALMDAAAILWLSCVDTGDC